MIEPVLVLRMMLPTMAATPGRDQSRGSTDESSGVISACAHSLRTTGDQAPYGARNRAGTFPVALWIAPVARRIWSAPAAGGSYTRSRWDQVWVAILWPAAATSRTRPGWAAAARPIIEIGAVTRYSSSSRRTCGVYSGLGPSSIVSATRLRPSWM